MSYERLVEAIQKSYKIKKKRGEIPKKKKRQPQEYDPYNPPRYVDELLDIFNINWK